MQKQTSGKYDESYLAQIRDECSNDLPPEYRKDFTIPLLEESTNKAREYVRYLLSIVDNLEKIVATERFVPENITLGILTKLIIGRIVEPWGLPITAKEESHFTYTHNRVEWNLTIRLDEKKRYLYELEVRRIGQEDSFALAERLQREFTIQSFNMDTNRCSFVLGYKDTRDIVAEENRDDLPYGICT